MKPFDVVIQPSALSGAVTVPPSKSLLHRALIGAAISQGTSTITPYVFSADINATINALRLLGVTINITDDCLVVTGMFPFKQPHTLIPVGGSASTLRMLLPLVSLVGQPVTFLTDNTLKNRPLDTYKSLYKTQLRITENTVTISKVNLPKEIRCDDLTSSQFISGLLFALPLLNQDTTLVINNPVSTPYIHLTCDVLRTHAIDITYHHNGFHIRGNQTYRSSDYVVEGDYSQAAFFIAAGLFHSTVTIHGLNYLSRQGDRVFIDFVKSMGANIVFDHDKIITKKSVLTGQSFDLKDCPDLAPIIACVATQAEGITTLVNVDRLVHKESNRLMAIIETLKALGAHIDYTDNTLTIKGVTPLAGSITLNGYHDHRMVMMLSIAASIAKGPITIKNAEAIHKSYPHFFEDYQALGGDVSFRRSNNDYSDDKRH